VPPLRREEVFFQDCFSFVPILKFIVDSLCTLYTLLAMKSVPMEKWGKDHWSLLAFIETLCVDHKGAVSDKHRRNFRTNSKTHPAYGYWPMGERKWNPAHGSRLKGYFDKNDPKLRLSQHDDWDCVEDFEAAGVLENQGSGMNPVFVLTPLGQTLTSQLRIHKQDGGHFATFDPMAVAK